ncbi:MAG: condensation domain-containing protein [Cyanobacteria bacterium P01_F01_bin.143]
MREDIQDIYPLSPIQQGILFHGLHNPEMALYHMHNVYVCQGNLNIAAFKQALQLLSDVHSVLRTSFYWEELDNPLQVVHEQVEVLLEYDDWRKIASSEQEKKLRLLLKEDRSRGFDFSQVPLIRPILIQTGDDTYYFVFVWHLIIIDGWSFPILLADLVRIYEALSQNQNVPQLPKSHFGEYIDWLQQKNTSKSQAEDFWREQLKGVKQPTPLHNLYSQNLANQEERYEDLQISLSTTTTQNLEMLAKQSRTTMSTFVQGAWGILTSYYSGKNKILYGCTFSGRPVDLKNSGLMIGEMVNTLPVNLEVDLNDELLPWLQKLQMKLVEIREYEYFPLLDIQKCSELPSNQSLFDSFVVFENQRDDKLLQEYSSLDIYPYISSYKTNYPFTIVGYPSSELTIGINYDFNLIDALTVTNILEHFKILLEGMVSKPQTTINELLLLINQKTHPDLLLLEKEMSLNFQS